MCYPYTTLVGTAELGYATDGQRPRYKRKPKSLLVAQWRPQRAAACDELIRRLTRLASADPPLHLDSHPVTHQLTEEPSPEVDVDYKHREDLIDAAICAWTAAPWNRHALDRCQILGPAAAATGRSPRSSPQLHRTSGARSNEPSISTTQTRPAAIVRRHERVRTTSPCFISAAPGDGAIY